MGVGILFTWYNMIFSSLLLGIR